MLIRKRKNKVEVEIILLTYNNISATKLSLSSIFQNTYINFGLIIIDNGSTDGTTAFLKNLPEKYNNITIFLNDKNLGCIRGRNFGYEIIKSLPNYPDYIIFLDNDQLVQKDWMKSYLKMIEKYDLIGIEAWQMKEDFYPLKKVISFSDYFNYVGGGGMLIKTKVIKEIGLFDEQFNPMYFEDPDLIFRVYQNNYKIGWNYHPVISHQPHQLLNSERRIWFNNSWKKFKKKWKKFPLPIFNNSI